MPRASSRARPWPKRWDGIRYVIDKDKLKAQYLAGAKYAWKDFCVSEGYNADMKYRREFPVRLWQSEWLQHKMTENQDSIMDEVIAVKSMVAKGRLSLPTIWNETALAAKSLGDYILRREMRKAQWNQQHEAEIDKNPELEKPVITPGLFGQLIAAQARILAMQSDALLIVRSQAYNQTIPVREPTPEDQDAENEGERLRNMGVTLLGAQEPVTQDQLAGMIKHYIDQEKDQVEEVAQEPIEDPNPLGDEE